MRSKWDAPGEAPDGSPRYWSRPYHYHRWVGFEPTDLFSEVFGVGPAIPLAAALQADGLRSGAVLRHAVAALLSASSRATDYPMTPNEVIESVRRDFDEGDLEHPFAGPVPT